MDMRYIVSKMFKRKRGNLETFAINLERSGFT